jgi:ubiquinol-cytochrome c reductase iron-sulfur subunit
MIGFLADHERYDAGTMRRLAAAMFLLSGAGSALFCAVYLFVSPGRGLGATQNHWLGTGLGITMAGLCAGLVLMAKTAEPATHGEQEREPHHSPVPDRLEAATTVAKGVSEDLGLGRHSVMRRSLLAALGLLPLPFLISLRSLGPKPRSQLAENAWRPGDLLVDPDTRVPIALGDLEIGELATVIPEGVLNPELPVNAESAVVVIRLPPGVNQPLPGHENWDVDGVVAYSKICTHAGCPVGLYEQQTHYLLCPCHQSTFDVAHGCKVRFGPAARPLPQLPLYADADGRLRARASFDQPVGPSYWERP